MLGLRGRSFVRRRRGPSADRTRRDIIRRVLVDEHFVSVLVANNNWSFAAVQSKSRYGSSWPASASVSHCS